MSKNDYNKKVGILYSWPIIIIAFIIFWPLAIYLVYKRVKIDKKAGLTIGKMVRFAAYFSYFIAAIGILACVGSGFKSEDVGMILFFIIAGVVLFIFSKKLITNSEKYKKYISIIINSNEFNIDNIAGAMSLTANIVKKDLADMINNGYFEGAYINNNTNEIVLPNRGEVNANDIIYQNKPQIEPRVISCKCCGAKNKVITSGADCEYCGSPL